MFSKLYRNNKNFSLLLDIKKIQYTTEIVQLSLLRENVLDPKYLYRKGLLWILGDGKAITLCVIT